MRRLRSLFWKIFVAVWIANIAIMVGTTHTILVLAQRDAREEKVISEARALTEEILQQSESERTRWRYRRGKNSNSPSLFSLAPGLNNLPSLYFENRIQIRTETGELIFGPEGDLREMSDKSIAFTFTARGGDLYQVVTLPPEEPMFILEDLTQRMQSISMLVILVVSGLVSLALTFVITRPIKRLGRHARELALGQLNTRVSGSLLHREDEIGDLAREFNNMADQLGYLIESRQQLLHDVSHELRAPLARLQAAAAIAQGKSDERARPPLERIDQECLRINALIQEILDYARLEQRESENRAVDLGKLLDEVAEDVRYEYPGRPIRFKSPTRPLVLNGSEELLRRAIENILRNACKYTPEDTAVDIALTADRQQIELRLRDHGPGVEDQEVDQLFSPFFRGVGKKDGEGFGLGLSIAARAIRHHHGQISARNAEHGGLEVQITLPRR